MLILSGVNASYYLYKSGHHSFKNSRRLQVTIAKNLRSVVTVLDVKRGTGVLRTLPWTRIVHSETKRDLRFNFETMSVSKLLSWSVIFIILLLLAWTKTKYSFINQLTSLFGIITTGSSIFYYSEAQTRKELLMVHPIVVTMIIMGIDTLIGMVSFILCTSDNLNSD